MVFKTSTPAIVISAVLGGSLAFLLTQLSIEIEPVETTAASQRVEVDGPSPLPLEPRPAPVALPQPRQSVSATPIAESLRVSNQTPYPIRVVLLARQTSAETMHWDFEPSEGAEQGIVLSLPTGQLNLEPGDVLTAFALDGSRRYWGPYLVGETALPAQLAPQAEWFLALTP